MTDYVAGFLLDQASKRVLLIRKKRPGWQAGRLNGIGGHIEAGETPVEAMIREFHEEAGLKLLGWQNFANVSGPWGKVYFFRLFTDRDEFESAGPQTDEGLVQARWDDLPSECLPNLSWLIPLALYTHDLYAPLEAKEM